MHVICDVLPQGGVPPLCVGAMVTPVLSAWGHSRGVLMNLFVNGKPTPAPGFPQHLELLCVPFIHVATPFMPICAMLSGHGSE